MQKWNHDNIPDLTGRTAIVTGSNSGIGFQAARALAHAGAYVTLACRNTTKAADANARIEAEAPAGSVDTAELDLSDLKSIRRFANEFCHTHDHLHLLVNNAGVMMPAERQSTADGFELQFGVNYLGHFALTGLLIDVIASTPGVRVVTVSAQAHRHGSIDFSDLNWDLRKYHRLPAYAQSKLANLLFMFELQRRFDAASVDAKAVAAHPGWSGTNLMRNTPRFEFLNRLIAMRPEQGALPILRAAADQEVTGGDYYGPDGWYEMRGYPVKVGTATQATRAEDATKLWSMSEKLTDVHYDALSASR